jgi:hypothetical protein
MATEDGKPLSETGDSTASAEFEPTYSRLVKLAAEMGPWTEEDEEFHKILTAESMLTDPGETLICDTSFVSHSSRRMQAPDRYAHWDVATVRWVRSARLASAS